LLSRKRAYIERDYSSLETEDAYVSRPVGPAAWEWFDRNFTDFARFTRMDGVIPVIVSQATLAKPENLDDIECRMLIGVELQEMTHPVLADAWVEATNRLRNIAQEHSALFVDAYSAVPATREYLEDHVHFTEAGRARLAEEIAAALIRNPEIQELVKTVGNSPGVTVDR
jgi:hypothetical protein